MAFYIFQSLCHPLKCVRRLALALSAPYCCPDSVVDCANSDDRPTRKPVAVVSSIAFNHLIPTGGNWI